MSWLDGIGNETYVGESGRDEGYWTWMAVGAVLGGVPMFGLGAALGATALIRAGGASSAPSGDPHG